MRKEANGIETIFQIGKDGVGENLINQIEDALRARELIKLRVLENTLLSPKEAAEEICLKTGAESVQVIGTRFVIYKRNEKEPKIVIE